MDSPTWDREHLWHYRASLSRVHDADTIVVLVDNGFRSRQEVHVRIADLWEPELWTEEGKARKAALEAALAEWLPAPQQQWNVRLITRQLVTRPDEVTSFDRWVADVWVVNNAGTMIPINGNNATLVAKLRRLLEG